MTGQMTIGQPAPLHRVDLPRSTGRALVVAGFSLLLIVMIAGPYLSFGIQPFTGEGNPIRQASYVMSFLLVILGLAPWKRGLHTLSLPPNIVLVSAWCVASLSWSISPAIGSRRLLLTLIVMAIIIYAVRELRFATTMRLTRLILLGALIGNWFTVLVLPHVGIHQVDPAGDSGIVGSWCGMMLHKNFAGAVCAMTIMVFALGYPEKTRWRWTRWLVILATAAFLWGTQSKTSAGIGAISMIGALAYRFYNPRYRALLLPFAIVSCVVLVFFINLYWRDVVAPLYDPLAFTGRTQIWPALFTYIGDHPMGAGFGSFWNIGIGLSPMFHYSRGWMAELGNGHNGYLDLAITIGLPGLALTILCMFVWPAVKLFASAHASKPEGTLALSFILFSIGHNFTESTLLERDVTVQIMLVMGIAFIDLATRRHRALTWSGTSA